MKLSFGCVWGRVWLLLRLFLLYVLDYNCYASTTTASIFTTTSTLTGLPSRSGAEDDEEMKRGKHAEAGAERATQ